MAYKHIRYEKSDRIARVILNRPRYKNAQSRLMIEEMDDAFAAASLTHASRFARLLQRILNAVGDKMKCRSA